MITSSSDGLSYSRLMTGVAGYEFASYGNRAAGKRNLPITKIATTTTELTINTLAGTPPVLVIAGAVPEPDGTSNTMLVVGTHDNNSTFQAGVLFDTTFNLPPNYWFNLTDTLTSWGATFDNIFTAIGTSDPVAIPPTMIQHLSGNGILGNPTSWEININFFGVLTNQDVVFFQYVLSDNLFNSYPLRTYSATNFANVGIGFPVMSFNVIDTVDLNGLRTNLQGGGAFQFTLTIYCFGQTGVSNSFLTSTPPIVSFSLKPLSYSV